METFPDWSDLLRLFNAYSVEYAIVGGHAVAVHGAVRATKDLDILVAPTTDNAKRVLRALNEFGYGSVGLTEEDFTRLDHFVQLGFPPARIDLMTQVPGLTWDELAQRRISVKFAGVDARVIGRKDLIHSKRALNRTQDKLDLELLGVEDALDSGHADE
ncbi:MAG: DUF6036 family nucleotidyltransferase [Planctomycetota bacterium]